MKNLILIFGIFFLSSSNFADANEDQRTLLDFTDNPIDLRIEFLEKFPVGTKLETLLKTIPKSFVVFEAFLDENDGIILPAKISSDRKLPKEIGVKSLRLAVNKRWPKGLVPYVEYLYVYIGLSDDDKLIDVQFMIVIDSI